MAATASQAQELLPAPGDIAPDTPLETPAPLQPWRIDPLRGVQFGLGLPYLEVKSEPLGVELRGGKTASTGVIINLDAVLDDFRIGYARQLYRRELPAGTQVAGKDADLLSFDGDQIWGFHGVRVRRDLYLGYGLAWQHRRIRVLQGERTLLERTESSFAAGLMADYALALPFSLQVRAFADIGSGFIEQRGAALLLTFMAGF